MATLSLEQAQRMIAAALAGERSSPARKISVAVCDAGGHPLALAREEGAAPLSAHIAQAKAFTCIAFGKTPGSLAAAGAEHEIWHAGISRIAAAKMGSPLAGSEGGLFVKTGDGQVLGAIGIAGERGDKDHSLAVLAIEAAGLTVGE